MKAIQHFVLHNLKFLIPNLIFMSLYNKKQNDLELNYQNQRIMVGFPKSGSMSLKVSGKVYFGFGQHLCYFIQLVIIINRVDMQLSPSYLQVSFSGKSFDLKSQTSTEGEQNQFAYENNNSSYNQGAISHFSSKAKTSLCKNFTSKGVCPYGKKCQFAHGPHQLRVNMEHNRSYKTKVCHAFQKQGFCCFGQRCNFIHDQSPAPLSVCDKWKLIYDNHRETINPPELEGNSRLLSLLQ